jgi:hypothetical protein
MVERTSVSLLLKSSACPMGVGNFPARAEKEKENQTITSMHNIEANHKYPWKDRDQEDGESA